MLSPIELINQLTERIELLEAKVTELEKALETTETNNVSSYQQNYLNFLKHRND